MTEESKLQNWSKFLIAYLLIVGIGSALIVSFNIPDLASISSAATVSPESVAKIATQSAAESLAIAEAAKAQAAADGAVALQAALEQAAAELTGDAKTAAEKLAQEKSAVAEAAQEKAASAQAAAKLAALANTGADLSPPPRLRWTFLLWRTDLGSIQSGLMLLAFFSGVAGSFIHATQSLASYLGNKTLAMSWFSWYFLRPWIGGVLGLAVFVVFSAGLVGQSSISEGDINIYGVVALALLGGWFSKTTSDKLQEVFETLFKSGADADRDDKLTNQQPVITSCLPNPFPQGETLLVLNGKGFQAPIEAYLNETKVTVTEIHEDRLTLDIGEFDRSAAAGKPVGVVVKNPREGKGSAKFEIEFD